MAKRGKRGGTQQHKTLLGDWKKPQVEQEVKQPKPRRERKPRPQPKQAEIPFDTSKEAAIASHVNTSDKQVRVLTQLEQKLRKGVDKKGKTLSDEEITKTKTTIANLEYKLGIKHEE